VTEKRNVNKPMIFSVWKNHLHSLTVDQANKIQYNMNSYSLLDLHDGVDLDSSSDSIDVQQTTSSSVASCSSAQSGSSKSLSAENIALKLKLNEKVLIRFSSV
jgi:hypothetical protein